MFCHIWHTTFWWRMRTIGRSPVYNFRSVDHLVRNGAQWNSDVRCYIDVQQWCHNLPLSHLRYRKILTSAMQVQEYACKRQTMQCSAGEFPDELLSIACYNSFHETQFKCSIFFRGETITTTKEGTKNQAFFISKHWSLGKKIFVLQNCPPDGTFQHFFF